MRDANIIDSSICKQRHALRPFSRKRGEDKRLRAMARACLSAHAPCAWAGARSEVPEGRMRGSRSFALTPTPLPQAGEGNSNTHQIPRSAP
jgi:hypothetical protein